MTDADTESQVSPDRGASEWHVGGLRLAASFRAPAGATLRVYGRVAAGWKEMLRFDDFIDGPHYHVPADADPISFDRAAHGEPLAWFVAQVTDHLEELLTNAGFTEVLADLDLEAVADGGDTIRKAMEDCVPDGFVRVAGVGLQRAEA